MDVLTQPRAKPALPFASTHALVDFPLSTLAASVVDEVWVSVQYLSHTLDPLLSGGRPHDLDRTRGGFRRLVPQQEPGNPTDQGFSQGNADGLFRIREQIRASAADVFVVLSADHIFSLDLDAALARHLEREADCTLMTAQVGVQEAKQKMVVTHDNSHRVTRVEDKPAEPTSGTVACEIFLYRTQALLDALDSAHARAIPEDESDSGLGDFGDHLLPALVRGGRVHADPLEGYWRDVGRVHAYLQAHRDLLAGRIDVFDHPDRPIRGVGHAGPPAWVGHEGALVEAMAGPGSRIRGRVERSVLGPGVQVDAGAHVVDSVLLEGVHIGAGARVHSSIIDRHARVGREATVGAPPASTRLTDEAIVVVGQGATLAGGAELQPGERVEPQEQR